MTWVCAAHYVAWRAARYKQITYASVTVATLSCCLVLVAGISIPKYFIESPLMLPLARMIVWLAIPQLPTASRIPLWSNHSNRSKCFGPASIGPAPRNRSSPSCIRSTHLAPSVPVICFRRALLHMPAIMETSVAFPPLIPSPLPLNNVAWRSDVPLLEMICDRKTGSFLAGVFC
jgi:hypothetical protein